MKHRVLWLTKGLGRGGAERLLALMAPRIDPERFKVDVAYLLPWKDAFAGELESAGTAVHCLGARSTTDPRWPLRLHRLLRREQYEIVHTHSPVPATAARLLVPKETRLVHTEHNVWDRYRWATYVGNAVTYARNSAVLAVSDGVAGSVVAPRWAPGKAPPVETLLHGVDPDVQSVGLAARARARAMLGLSTSTPVVGTVANFTPKKDLGGLLAATDLARRHIPDLVLLLVGSGPLEATLRADVAARGLDEHVRFLGVRDDVERLLPALDVFVLGSRYEGLPISLLEAMGAELPCVATSVGGIPEALADGVEGVLVPPGEPGQLASAMVQLLLDGERRSALGMAARERVRRDFSIDRAVRRTEQVYESVLTHTLGGA